MFRYPVPLLVSTLLALPALAQQTPASQPAGTSFSTEAKTQAPAPGDRAGRTPEAEKKDEQGVLDRVVSPDRGTMTPRRVVEDDIDARILLYDKGPFRLQVGGLVQVQAAFYVGQDADLEQFDPADAAGFRIRRARIGFAGALYDDWHFFLALDMRDVVVGGNEVLDARLAWTRFPWLSIAAGLDKIPFSALNLQSSSRLELIERPLTVQYLAPDRRVGASLFGFFHGLEYAAGIYNGSDGVVQGNRMAGVAAVARLQYHIFGRPQEFVPRPLRLALGGAFMYNNGAALTHLRAAGNLDLWVFYLRLQGEFIWESSSPKDDPTGGGTPETGDTTSWGAVGELSGFVWPGWLQLAARFEYLKINERNPTMGNQMAMVGGLNFYIYEHHLKLMFNYQHRRELEGRTWDNDIAFAMLQGMF
jgi:hypothetical protein